ncbi:Hypothetical protein of unknown function [Listeria ivanovii subsp. ivanovii PAM 55]|uniref:Uncharacterized protein n=2 Tax=Listeria ivanovii TaxID=1638 RepID=G2ZB25_LISIP|nr:Hypothetical protein of unknown function [Listeria ivanovii subsp. ivanovii PAM 55]
MTKKYCLILGGLLLLICLFPYSAKAAENTNLPQTKELAYDATKILAQTKYRSDFLIFQISMR